ncbi:MAG: CpXC domain-containing protein, partial [Erysipelotrichaceae bacterium]
PELKERVLAGELFKFNCETCGTMSICPFPVLYHDMDKKLFIYYEPNDPSSLEKMLNDDESLGMDPSYIKRITTDISLFLEKVQLLDQGYDDKIIEICKIAAHMQTKQQHPDIEIDSLLFDPTKDDAVFGCIHDGSIIGSIGFSTIFYDELQKDYAEILNQDTALIIDKMWTVNFLNEILPEA